MKKEEITFSFGKNWEEFIKKSFSQERIEISKNYILDFLELPDLSDKYFLDVGCGSGLSSLAALEAGAKKIVSFDVDSYSVKTTEKLRQMR
ncbi:MAG: 50S ribosomal protein L11 methyltransferase, partial [Candidatus Omnitrophica bacterium]|nr:50S ribosomal protein L11 methyltransferase [Candidatus Omnitrophota bacterium]